MYVGQPEWYFSVGESYELGVYTILGFVGFKCPTLDVGEGMYWFGYSEVRA